MTSNEFYSVLEAKLSQDAPEGDFPTIINGIWQADMSRRSWTPTFSASGGGTWSASSTEEDVLRIGPLVWFNLHASGAVNAGNKDYLIAELPVEIAGSPPDPGEVVIAGYGSEVAGGNFPILVFPKTGTDMQIYKSDFTQWTGGATCSIKVSGFYPVR